ncbi:hypothetical protein SDC9_158904 [bioreactor metagenome]|uniref:Uncharacterized protein n=1 Tax=bioreactor metagenome TaxID=1076179 RepID=A0A645FBB9_9ZZZZ
MTVGRPHVTRGGFSLQQELLHIHNPERPIDRVRKEHALRRIHNPAQLEWSILLSHRPSPFARGEILGRHAITVSDLMESVVHSGGSEAGRSIRTDQSPSDMSGELIRVRVTGGVQHRPRHDKKSLVAHPRTPADPPRNGIVAVIRRIGVIAQSVLFEDINTSCFLSRLPRLIQGGQQNGSENRDDRDHNQQFNQRESRSPGKPGERSRRGKKEQRKSRCNKRLVTRQRHLAAENHDHNQQFSQRKKSSHTPPFLYERTVIIVLRESYIAIL